MYEFSIYIASIFAAILILTLVFKVKMEHIERFGTLATAIATMLLAIATIYLAWNAGQQLVEIRSAATQTNEIISSYQRIAKSGEALLVASQRA
jgi:drug/metabolite transporter (DMT)-like permease